MTDSESVQRLFTRNLFSIPDYQRGYAWEERHLEEFWEDLLVLPDGMDHYTGTLVLRPRPREEGIRDDGGTLHTVADVVDGQQRLTTITLLLAALRRRFLDLGESEIAEALSRNFLWIRQGGAARPRLWLGGDDAAYWRDVVLADTPALRSAEVESHTRLDAAKSFLDARVQDLHDVDTLLDVRDIVTDRLQFSLYAVTDDAQVGVIFETVNGRGKDLTELERTKNYLLFLVSALEPTPREQLAQRTNAAWAQIHRQLMRADLGDARFENQLLRTHWLMSRDPVRNNWDGSKSIKSTFDRRSMWQDPAGLVEVVGAYVDELADASTMFCDAYRPSRTGSFVDMGQDIEEVRRASENLRRAGYIASFLPLLMAIRLTMRGDAQTYLEALRHCEAFAFRVYGLVGARSNAGQSRFFSMAHNVYRGDAAAPEVLRGLRDAVTHWSRRSSFEEELLLEGDRRNWYEWGHLRYFLWAYEEHLTRRGSMQIDWAEIRNRDIGKTIEHILPQTPREGEWPAFTDADRQALTHDLGNLVLTFDNSAYSNKSFVAKRGADGDTTAGGEAARVFARSRLLQEQEIAAHDDWTPESIRDRHAKLARWALERWGIEGDEVPPDPTDVDEAELSDPEE